MRILIDPAHGGTNLGHVSPSGMVVEKQATLTAARVMQSALGRHFIAVLSREGDEDVSHSQRAALAVEYDLTLSLHFHVAANPHQQYVATSTRTKASEEIARLILDHVGKTTGERTEHTPTMNRITHGDRPVVILMGGLASHPDTERAITDGARYVQLASAVRAALLQHCNMEEE